MKLVMYLRVSGKGQVDGYGLDAQEADCRRWAKANGHTIIKEACVDEGLSGTLDSIDRPGLDCAMTTVRDRRDVGGLLIPNMGRLARAITVQEAVLAVIWRTGGAVFAADQGEILPDDPDDPVRTLMRQMMGVVTEFDRRSTVKKLRHGRLAKAATGRKSVGDYAYGTQAGGKGRDRDAVPNDDEQAVLARILELRADGYSYRRICAALEADSVPTRREGRRHPATVQKYVQRAGAA